MELGADPNITTKGGSSALYLYLGSTGCGKSTEIPRMLIEYGIDVNLQRSDGNTAFNSICRWYLRTKRNAPGKEILQNYHMETILLLFEAGADPYLCSEWRSRKNWHDAEYKANLTELEELCEAYATQRNKARQQETEAGVEAFLRCNMPKTKTDKDKHTATSRRRRGSEYRRLKTILESVMPDASRFRLELEKALAAGFPIDSRRSDDWTLLHHAVCNSFAVRAGLPQMLIEVGADVNAQTADGRTSLSGLSEYYVLYGEQETFALIVALLEAGAAPEIDERWIHECWKHQNQMEKSESRARMEELRALFDAYLTKRNETRAHETEACAEAFMR